MACNISRQDRAEKMQELVLKYFQNIDPSVSLETSLGPDGLGHLPAKRKMYYPGLRDALADSKCGCVMQKLKPSSFGDTPQYATVGTIADMLAKDIG